MPAPAPPSLARLRLKRRVSTPEGSAAAAPEASEGPAGGGYLIVRGESRLDAAPRRRLVRTPTTRRPDDPRPAKPARIIGHSPGFGRAIRRAARRIDGAPRPGEPRPTTATVAPAPPDLPPASTPARRRGLAAVVLLGVVLVGGATLALWRRPAAPPDLIPADEDVVVSAVSPASTPPAAAPLPLVPASTITGPEPQVRLVPSGTRPVGAAAALSAEIIDVRTLPTSSVVAVTGTVHNPTAVPLTAIQLEVTLQAGDVPIRRRDVFCCDDFGAAALAGVVGDPTHPHYRSRRGLSSLAVLSPQSSETFVAIFPDLPDAPGGRGPLSALVRVVTGALADTPAITNVAAGDL